VKNPLPDRAHKSQYVICDKGPEQVDSAGDYYHTRHTNDVIYGAMLYEEVIERIDDGSDEPETPAKWHEEKIHRPFLKCAHPSRLRRSRIALVT
jgi:hypothetical protein